MHQPPFRNERAAASVLLDVPRRVSWVRFEALSHGRTPSAIAISTSSLTGVANPYVNWVSGYCPLEKCHVPFPHGVFVAASPTFDLSPLPSHFSIPHVYPRTGHAPGGCAAGSLDLIH